jgi:hypothetical protein
VWTIPSILRNFYLLWEVCAFTRSVLLGNSVNNLDQLRVTYKKILSPVKCNKWS